MNAYLKTNKWIACLITTGLLTSCQLGGGLGFPSPQILSLLAKESQQELVIGQPISLSLKSKGGLLDVHGKEPKAPPVIKWSLKNPADGEIKNGQLIPKRTGKITLIAKFKHGIETFEINIVDLVKPGVEEVMDSTTKPDPAIIDPQVPIPVQPTPQVNTPVGGEQPIVIVNSISLSPSTIRLSNVGESSLFNVMARNDKGEFLDTASLKLTWASSHPDTIAVDGNGMVTAVKAGGATITMIETESGLTASAIVRVTNSGTGTRKTGPINSVSGNVTF